MSKSTASRDFLNSNIESLIRELLQTDANKDNSIVSYRKDINDEYVFFVVNEAVIDTTLRMMWILVYKPTMKIVDSGRDKIFHSMTLIRSAVGDIVAKKHEEMLDKAMVTLEIEKWLTEE